MTIENLCPINEDCPFFRKETYTIEEIYFYQDYCLKSGVGCGLKKNYDISERIKRINTYGK